MPAPDPPAEVPAAAPAVADSERLVATPVGDVPTFRGVFLRAVVGPFLTMMLLATVLVVQIGRMQSAAAKVEHSDLVLAELYQFKLQLLDMQSSVRGYLLTRGDPQVLAPFDNARPMIDATFNRLTRLTSDRPAAVEQVAQIGPRYRAYIERLEQRIAAGRAGDFELPADFQTSLGQVVELRARVRHLIDEETALRGKRFVQANREATITTFGVAGVVLLAGGLLAALSREQLHRLSRAYEASLARSTELSQTLERRVEERTAELTRVNARLGEANRELEAFSYSVSHDLRAPMRHITGFAKLLKSSARGQLTADDVENLDTIHDTAVFAGRLVDDLLAFSRVGRTQLKRGEVDMNALVRRSVADLEPDLAGRTIDWAIADLPPTTGDAALLKMVWQNLLANAVKYTARKASARIEVGASRGDGETTYFVRDDGVGFDMAYAHKLFGVFQRLHRAEEFEGTGIGLANVRRIILRHDGEVWAEGKLGEGATFSFRLPDRPIGESSVHEATS